MNKKNKYIVKRMQGPKTWFVAAPPGYYRKADGTGIKKGGGPSPEWTDRASEAYEFRTYRAAAITKNKCAYATINIIPTHPFDLNKSDCMKAFDSFSF